MDDLIIHVYTVHINRSRICWTVTHSIFFLWMSISWWMAKRCCSYFTKDVIHLPDMLCNVYILRKEIQGLSWTENLLIGLRCLYNWKCLATDIIGPLPETNRRYHWSKSIATKILWNKIIANYGRPLITSIHYSYQP